MEEDEKMEEDVLIGTGSKLRQPRRGGYDRADEPLFEIQAFDDQAEF